MQAAKKSPQPVPVFDTTDALWTENLAREHGFTPLAVEGALPRELVGTIYRNGPGLYELFGQRVGHPFEADGAVSAVRLDGAGAQGAVRLTNSAGLAEERGAGRRLYGLTVPWLRRVRNSLRRRYKNTANTNVLIWQDRLFALMEAARPTEIDPHNLTTIGETDLGGVVGAMFSAHPHRVVPRRATYNFGLEYGRKSKLHLYRFPDEGSPSHLGAVELPGPPMLHDFIATETHLVFLVPAVRVHVPRMLLGVGGFADLFKWRPSEGTEVVCVPIDDPTAAVRFTVEPFYQWHFANAWSEGGELVVDYVRYPDFSSFYAIGEPDNAAREQAFSAARYHRARIDLTKRALRSEPLGDIPCEFPRVDPRREGTASRYTWLVLGDLSSIGRLDTRTGALAVHEPGGDVRVSEPVFVPRAGGDETDGWVLSYHSDEKRSCLAVYDAARFEDGPVARAWFDQRLPITFHGSFAAR